MGPATTKGSLVGFSSGCSGMLGGLPEAGELGDVVTVV